MITRFELLLTTRPLLSQILDPTVLVPKDHRVTRIDDRYVESGVVFKLKEKLCLILGDLAGRRARQILSRIGTKWLSNFRRAK